MNLGASTRAYCSPQKRTRQTAEIALGSVGLVPVFDHRLREIHLGLWEGQLYRDVIARDPGTMGNLSVLELCLSGPGETEADMRARLKGFLDDLGQGDGPVVVISHGIALTFLRAVALGSDMAAMEAMGRAQGVVYELRNGREITHEMHP